MSILYLRRHAGVLDRAAGGMDSLDVPGSTSDPDLEHPQASGPSYASFNSEEGFGSPIARSNRPRRSIFDMDDHDMKVLP